MLREGTMCPKSIVGKPGIWMSHTCVDLICFPSGKLIVRGDVAGRLLSTSALSIIKMEVAPVSAIPWFVAIVSALRYCGMGYSNNAQAVNTIDRRTCCVACRWHKGSGYFSKLEKLPQMACQWRELFDVGSGYFSKLKKMPQMACRWRKLFDVITVFSSSFMDDVPLMGVGFEAGSQAETKWLHLCAIP
jgi:hypothetical protein